MNKNDAMKEVRQGDGKESGGGERARLQSGGVGRVSLRKEP